MTKTLLKWRLSKLPTSEEVLKLINDKVITKEEGREILFSEETEKEVNLEDAKKEIKFLRELIEKLGNRNQIIETIRYVEKPYYVQPWYQPYAVWCSSGTQLLGANAGNSATTLCGTNTLNCAVTDVKFSAIH